MKTKKEKYLFAGAGALAAVLSVFTVNLAALNVATPNNSVAAFFLNPFNRTPVQPVAPANNLPGLPNVRRGLQPVVPAGIPGNGDPAQGKEVSFYVRAKMANGADQTVSVATNPVAGSGVTDKASIYGVKPGTDGFSVVFGGAENMADGRVLYFYVDSNEVYYPLTRYNPDAPAGLRGFPDSRTDIPVDVRVNGATTDENGKKTDGTASYVVLNPTVLAKKGRIEAQVYKVAQLATDPNYNKGFDLLKPVKVISVTLYVDPPPSPTPSASPCAASSVCR